MMDIFFQPKTEAAVLLAIARFVAGGRLAGGRIFRTWMFAAIVGLCWLNSQPASAASSRLCLRNTGDTQIQVAILYKGSWGGWFAEGWWQLDPQGVWGGCTLAPPAGTSSNFHYVAVRQEGRDGRWGSAAFDVYSVRWEEDGMDTIGATFKLVPRATPESSQGTSVWGLEQDVAGDKIVLCAPSIGVKEIGALKDEQSCSGNDILTLFGTKLYTPTDGPWLEDNTYEIYFQADANAPTFQFYDPAPVPKADSTPQPPVAVPPPPQSFFPREDPAEPKLAELEAAATAGDVEAQKRLAHLHMSGELGERQPDTAAKWFLVAASAGDADAQYELACLYLDGHVAGSVSTGMALLAIAAKGGSAKAAERLKTMQ